PNGHAAPGLPVLVLPVAGGCQLPAIRAEHQLVDDFQLAREGAQLLPGRRIPDRQPTAAVRRDGTRGHRTGDRFAVAAPRHRPPHVGDFANRAERLAATGIPDLHLPAAERYGAAAVAIELEVPGPALCGAFEEPRVAARQRVPSPDDSIATRGHELLAVRG